MYWKFNDQDVRIGWASGETFHKEVKQSIHLFRKFNAWGIDKQVVEELLADGVRNVLIHEVEHNVYYFATLNDYVEHGIEGDYGHSVQLFLPLKYFKMTKPSDTDT